MKSINHSLLGFSCAVLLAIGVFAPLPAHAARVFNVKLPPYNASGDGVTDDTVHILQAARAAAMDPGSTLLFPNGNYIFDGELLNVTSIDMVGESATLTMLNGPVQLNGSNVHVHGMSFATRNPSSPTGMLVTNVNGFEIRNCAFRSGFANGISVTGSSNGKINANVFTLSKANVAGVNIGNASNISAQKNTFEASTSGTGSGFYIVNSSGITIHDNFFHSVGITSTQNTTSSYTNNSFIYAPNSAVDMNGDKRIEVNENDFLDAGTAVNVANVTTVDIHSNVMRTCKTGIALIGSSSNVDIRRNTVYNADLNGITGGGVTALSIYDNIIDGAAIGINLVVCKESANIAGNQIAETQTAGINMTSFTGSSVVRKNTFRDCGRSGGNPRAVVYADSPQATQIRIDSNTYSGPTKGLTYFIWCVQKQPPAQISGNSTNTSLPNRIGS